MRARCILKVVVNKNGILNSNLRMLKDNFDRKSWRPVRLKYRSKNWLTLTRGGSNVVLVDQYNIFIEELFLLRNPRFKFEKIDIVALNRFKLSFLKNNPAELSGGWFYFPWLNQLVHFLPEIEHLELRTGRNRNLITSDEQSIYYKATVAVLGMSVGSHVALTLVMTGGAKKIILADPDTISGSNLNRIRVGFHQIGLSKVRSVARQIFEINPYSQIDIYDDGVTDKNLIKIFNGKNKPALVIEEMDNPYFKIKTRELARRKGVPVIMAADNGDGVNVDVERYDLNKKLPILHGLIPNLESKMFKSVDPKDLVGIMAKMAGSDYASKRMLKSVALVGKKLYSWPQLGTAATLCGSVLANLGRRIILDEKINSGRFIVNELTMFK